MKLTILLMAGAAVLALAACDARGNLAQPTMKAVSKLDCPARQGELQRVSVAADGKSCRYTDNDGGEVTLQLVAVSGDADATLKPIEASLAALVPDINAKPAEAAVAAADAAKDASASQAAATGAAKDASVSAAMAASDAGAAIDAADPDPDPDPDRDHDADDDVQVDLPGVHVRTKGDKADVRVFGMRIEHDEGTDTTHVKRGKPGRPHQFVVDANDNGAVIRMHGGSSTNLKSRVIYATNQPGPQGDRLVGYVARGPRTGPLVVATVRSKREDAGDDIDIHEGIFDDAGRLVRKASRG